MNARRWLPPLAWAGVILFLTSTPERLIPSHRDVFDGIAHFSMYAVLGILLARQLAQVTDRWRAMALSVAIAVAFAVVDEWHQQFIPGRRTELADVRADFFGAAAGASLFMLFRRQKAITHA